MNKIYMRLKAMIMISKKCKRKNDLKETNKIIAKYVSVQFVMRKYMFINNEKK